MDIRLNFKGEIQEKRERRGKTKTEREKNWNINNRKKEKFLDIFYRKLNRYRVKPA
jgi:hypothetical protein